MGLRFRRSMNLGGGFRINFSKSGVGYSWGVPGYRVTKTATGRKRRTYSIPGTGISYVDENKSKLKNNEGDSYNNPSPVSIQQDNITDINSAAIEEFQPAEHIELINRISKTLLLNRISNILLWTILLVYQPIFIITVIIGIVMKIVIYVKGKVELDYELDEYRASIHKNRIDAFTMLNENKKLWQIIQAAFVLNSKVNAGAGMHINRRNFKFLTMTPFYLKINTNVLQVILLKETLILLPDKILIIRGIKVGAIDYDNVKINVSDANFIEKGKVPKDAKIIGYTWQYVNKDGSPDKRYKNNVQYPICLYGRIQITSPNGLNIEMQCSDVEIAKLFDEKIHNIEKSIK